MPIVVITQNTTVQSAVTPDNVYTGISEVSIRQENPGFNYDSDTDLALGNGGSDNNVANFFLSSLSQVPSNATINNAYIRLVPGGGFGSFDVVSHSSLRVAVQTEATYNNFAAGSAWQTAGARGALDRNAAVSAATAISDAASYNIPITAEIAELVSAGADQLLIAPTAFDGDGGFRNFIKSTGTDGSRPELVVDWSIASEEDFSDYLTSAENRRVSFVMLGDSNQGFSGTGWDQHLSDHLGQLYGLYASPQMRDFNGVFGGASQFSVGLSNFTGAAPANSVLQDQYVSSRELDADITPNAASIFIENAVTPFNIEDEIAFRIFYGTYPASEPGTGQLNPRIRLAAAPYTTVAGPVQVDTKTGAHGIQNTTLALAAGARQERLQLSLAASGGSVLTPATFYFFEAEAVNRASGLQVDTLYGVGGASLRDCAETLQGYSDQQLTTYFSELRARQNSASPRLCILFNFGLNDRNETLPSVGPGNVATGNSAAAYRDNVEALIARIDAVFAANGWPLNEIRYCGIASHVVSDPLDSQLQEYRAELISLSASNPRLSTIDLSTLLSFAEMTGNYDAGGNAHLTSAGYSEVSQAIVDSIAGVDFSDVTYDGSTVDYATTESFKELIESDHSVVLVANVDQVHWRITSGPTIGSTVGTDTVPDFEPGVVSGEYQYTHNGVRSSTYTWQVEDFSTFTIDAIESVTVTEGEAYTSDAPTINGTPNLPVTFSLFGADASQFTFNASSGVVALSARTYSTPDDADNNNIYEIGIVATDALGQTAARQWTVEVLEFVAVPTVTPGQTFVLGENSNTSVNARVPNDVLAPDGANAAGLVQTTGPTPASFTIDNANFTIDSSGRIQKASSDPLTPGTYTVGVTPDGGSLEDVDIIVIPAPDYTGATAFNLNLSDVQDGGATINLVVSDSTNAELNSPTLYTSVDGENQTLTFDYGNAGVHHVAQTLSRSVRFWNGTTSLVNFVDQSIDLTIVDDVAPAFARIEINGTNYTNGQTIELLDSDPFNVDVAGSLQDSSDVTSGGSDPVTFAEVFNDVQPGVDGSYTYSANITDSVGNSALVSLTVNVTGPVIGVVSAAEQASSISATSILYLYGQLNSQPAGDTSELRTRLTGNVYAPSSGDVSTSKAALFSEVSASSSGDVSAGNGVLSVVGDVDYSALPDRLLSSLSSGIQANIDASSSEDETSGAIAFTSLLAGVVASNYYDSLASSARQSNVGWLSASSMQDLLASVGNLDELLRPSSSDSQRYFYAGMNQRIESTKSASSDEPFLIDWSSLDEELNAGTKDFSIDSSQWRVKKGSVVVDQEYLDGKACFANVSGGIKGEVAVIENTVSSISYGYLSSKEIYILII